MSIVSISSVPESHMTLPPAHEAERPLWREYVLSLEGGPGIPDTFSTLSNAVLGHTEFINEVGTLKGLCPLIEPTFLGAFQDFLHAIGATDFLFEFQLRFKNGDDLLGAYSFGMSRTFSTGNYNTGTNPFSPFQCAAPGGGTYDAYPFTTDIVAGFASGVETKTQRLNVNGNTGDSAGRCAPTVTTATDSVFEMYGQNHLDIATSRRPLSNVSYVKTGDFLETRFNGNESFDTLDAKGGRFPFALDIPTPCTLEMRVSMRYRVGSVDGTFIAVQPTAPNQVFASFSWPGAGVDQIALAVLWEDAGQGNVFWHPSRAIYEAKQSDSGVVIGRHMGFQSGEEILITLPNLKSPCIWQCRNGDRYTGIFELLARNATMGKWELYQSQNGGTIWNFMGRPFEATNIARMVGIATRDGAAVAAIVGGNLVFKRTTNKNSWPPDSDAVPVREGFSGTFSLCLATDGSDDFLIVTSAECIVSKDGGRQWP